MVAVKLMNFGGMIPSLDPHLLPANSASSAQNVYLRDGKLYGLPEPTIVRTLTNSDAKKVFRVPASKWGRDNIADSYWLEFTSTDVDVIPSPLASDSYERYYWAGQGVAPAYNTKARIAAASSSYILGIPAPDTAPSVAVTGGSAPTETRAYVYTWVSEYGEEGPPSPPTTYTGNADGSWDLTLMSVGAYATGRNLTHTNIYRTITGTSGSTTYYFVKQVTIATTTPSDTELTVDVAANGIIESTYWSAPPTDLVGMFQMANGIIAGWRENEVWFCEPYRPHAWPAPYVLAFDGQVIGVGGFNQTIVVCTNTSPYAVSGVDPASMTVSKLGVSEPCMNRGSIVSSISGVAYASQNGMVTVSPAGANLVTKDLIPREVWLDNDNYLQISTIRGAMLGEAYYCWCSPGSGCFESTAFESTAFTQTDYTAAFSGAIIDVSSNRTGYIKLLNAALTENCFTDIWTGDIFFIRSGQVQWLNFAPSVAREEYVWRSKILETPNQRNMQALRIYFSDQPMSSSVTFPDAWWEDTELWDDAALWDEGASAGVVRVYGDGVLRYERDFRNSGDVLRLPAGYKATYWEIEVQSAQPVYSIEVSTSMMELGSV